MRILSLLLVVPVIASCAMAPGPAPVRGELAEARLQSLIAGRVAGPPSTCLPSYRSGGMVVIDDNTIAFRSSSNQIWVNQLRGGGCDRLGTGHYTLVTRAVGSASLCSGDIAQVADLTTGMTVGSCVLGDFVPYSRPGS